ncbi:MAG: glycerol-3-phosphate 1-O-acyltransferase PlsY [candidate division WOR-3 bacterium]
MIIKVMVSLLIGFIFGMIPFSYIIGKIKGIDLKRSGSGNIGATNLGRILGLKFFILGFLLDGAKGLIPVVIAHQGQLMPAIAGVGAIVGHIFNPLFKFRGGKGVSTTIGVISGIVPKQFFISLGAWLIVYFCTFIVSLASITFAIVLLFTTLISADTTQMVKGLILLIVVLIIIAHRSNIKRLLKKTEPKTIFWRKG